MLCENGFGLSSKRCSWMRSKIDSFFLWGGVSGVGREPRHYLVSLLSWAIEDWHNEDDKNCDKTKNVPCFKDI